MAKKTTNDNVQKPIANCDQFEEPITNCDKSVDISEIENIIFCIPCSSAFVMRKRAIAAAT